MTGRLGNCSMPAVTRSPIFLLLNRFTAIMTFAGNQLKKLGSYCEKTAAAFFDAAMTTHCNVPVC